MSIRLAGFTLKDTLGYIYGSGMPKGQDMETALRRTDPSNVDKGVGYHSQLKPAIEPIVLAFKPISEKTVAKNVVKHGTGALHTAACRVGDAQRVNPPGSTNPRVAMGDGWRTDAQPTLPR
jgi:site-specific DNA-methyltransferase (adenine-specific)